MNEISNGDVVQLKSGSLAMTVVEVVDGKVVCQWFDKANVKKADFTPESLVPFVRRSLTSRGIRVR